jgi:hypothetical protein
MQGMKRMVGLGDDSKELVDPYLIFSFAGKEVSMNINSFKATLYSIQLSACARRH